MYFPICIGHIPTWAYRVGKGTNASQSLSCIHDAVFYGSDTQLPGMVPISIGHHNKPHCRTWRHIMKEGDDAGGRGWIHDFTFYAYMEKKDETVPVGVGHANNQEDGGWKYRFSVNCENVGNRGWTHAFTFYAPIAKPIEETKPEDSDELEEFKEFLADFNPKIERLKEIDLFVLDNSLRETTVGALRGHTLQNKYDIYEQTQKVGFEHNIIASFSHMTRVGDTFIQELQRKGEDFSNKYAFSEFADDTDANGIPLMDIPIGLQKCQQLRIPNVVMEADLVYYKIDYDKFNHEKMCEMFDARFKWIRKNLSEDSKILLNLRDLPDAMKVCPGRTLKTVKYLAEYRPQIFGIITEEATGRSLPEELGAYTKACRRIMDKAGYDGHFMYHVHEQWGMADASQLECLANGATGIWCGLCEEGASVGHASSILTIMNLVRLGNKKVLKKFNCEELRNAAIEVTKIVTGQDPHYKQPIYGGRALDQVFGLPQFDTEKATDVMGTFDMAKFFGLEATKRITPLADAKMIKARMERLFGEHADYTLEIGDKMREVMLNDYRSNKKEEYHSAVGLATLFDRAGGQKNQQMIDALSKFEVKSLHIQGLIDELHDQWKEWDLRDGVKDDRLTFDNFYDGFMKGYFGCYRCSETKKALKAINVNDDESIDWDEFSIFLKWAGHEYPHVHSAEMLLDIAFREGIIPAMQDELVQQHGRK